jgi:hypothetical protein
MGFGYLGHLGVNGSKTIWSPDGPHVICPDGDHNLTLMAQLPPIWATYVLLDGHRNHWKNMQILASK